MLSVKDTAKKIINDLPDDVSYDELIKELLFKRMVERGIRDSKKIRLPLMKIWAKRLKDGKAQLD